MSWDDEKRAQAVELYEAAGPTPETSTEIVQGIADELEESVNGVRMILVKAGVYMKKEPVAKKASAGGGGTRVSKAAAQEALVAAIQDAGQEVDMEIVSRLTGKAAMYLAEVINGSNS